MIRAYLRAALTVAVATALLLLACSTPVPLPVPDPSADDIVTAYNDGWIDGVADLLGDDNRDGIVDEDESGWNCLTMGNRICGPTPAPLTRF